MTSESETPARTLAERRQAWKSLRYTPEGRIYIRARLAAIAYLLFLIGAFYGLPEHADHLLAMTALNVFIGRGGGMAYGYSVGYGDVMVVGINGLVETLLVLLLYPLFHFSWNHALEVPTLKPMMTRTREAAERNKSMIQRYGPVGLIAFVFTPFAMTGPVVGSAIGVLLGLPTRTILLCVLLGTYVAYIGWAYVLREVGAQVAALEIEGSILLLIAAVLVACGWLWKRHRRRMREAEEGSQSE